MTDISSEQINSSEETGFSSREYNSVAKIAELATINLLKVKANIPPGFQVGEETQLTYGRWDPLESTCRHASLSIL